MSAESEDRYGIKRRLDEAGRTQAELARYLKLDASSMTKTIKGKRQLKSTELLALDGFFAADAHAPAVASFNPVRTASAITTRIPIFGYAAASSGERIALNDGRIIEWIEPPPFKMTGGEYFGVRVLNDSMEPRYFAGEYAVAQRDLPPVRDRDCLVEFHDGSGLIKTFRFEKDGVVFCRQWNPDIELRFSGTEVKALHAIVWRR